MVHFYRRINAYVEVTNDNLIVYDFINEKGCPIGYPAIYFNRVASLKAQPKKNKTNFKAAFAQICDEIPIEQTIDFLNERADKYNKPYINSGDDHKT